MYGHNPHDLKYRFQRVAPIEVSPHDPNVVYHGSQYLHRTARRRPHLGDDQPRPHRPRPEYQVVSGEPITRDVTGEEVFSTLYAIDESPLERGVIWTGSNDGVVHGDAATTAAAGANVTPPQLPPTTPASRTSTPPSHHRGEAYVAAYRYLLDDWHPYLFRTTDYGAQLDAAHRRHATASPPTTRCASCARTRRATGLLYAGTEFGLFVSFDDGARWQPLQLEPARDPRHRHRRPRERPGPLHHGPRLLDPRRPRPPAPAQPGIAAENAHLFAPDPAWRMRYRAPRPEAAAPEYPPVGAWIDYWLGAAPAGELRLEILDDHGRVLRTFSSRGTRDPLPATAGLHRVRWDLALPGPWRAASADRPDEGPLALPGRYRVRLAADDWTRTQPLQLRLDPRVAAAGVSPADLAAQLELALRTRDLLGRARRAAAAVEAALEAPAARADTASLRRLRARLVTSREGSYPQPMLVDQIDYLYGMLTTADQRPGQDAYQRYRELEAQVAEAEAEMGRRGG